MTELEEALVIAKSIVQFRFHKSMNELKNQIRSALKERGLQEQMRNFKLTKANEAEVNVYIRPGAV